MNCFLVAALVVWVSSALVAETGRTGDLLLRECTNTSSLDFCSGYLAGILDTLELTGSERGLRSNCAPKDSFAQLRDVVTAYLRNNPAKRHLPAVNLIAAAFFEAFPCR